MREVIFRIEKNNFKLTLRGLLGLKKNYDLVDRDALELDWAREKGERMIRGVCTRLGDKNWALASGALKILQLNRDFENSQEDRTIKIVKNFIARISDADYRLKSDGFKILKELMAVGTANEELLRNRQKAFVKRYLDSEYGLMAAALNRLKANSRVIFNIKRSFCLKIADQGMNLMGQGMRKFREFNFATRDSEAKTLRSIEGVVKRMMDTNLRLVGGTLKYLKNFITKGRDRDAQKRQICNRICDKNFALLMDSFALSRKHCKNAIQLQKKFRRCTIFLTNYLALGEPMNLQYSMTVLRRHNNHRNLVKLKHERQKNLKYDELYKTEREEHAKTYDQLEDLKKQLLDDEIKFVQEKNKAVTDVQQDLQTAHEKALQEQ
jgi:hypothetical protein